MRDYKSLLLFKKPHLSSLEEFDTSTTKEEFASAPLFINTEQLIFLTKSHLKTDTDSKSNANFKFDDAKLINYYKKGFNILKDIVASLKIGELKDILTQKVKKYTPFFLCTLFGLLYRNNYSSSAMGANLKLLNEVNILSGCLATDKVNILFYILNLASIFISFLTSTSFNILTIGYECMVILTMLIQVLSWIPIIAMVYIKESRIDYGLVCQGEIDNFQDHYHWPILSLNFASFLVCVIKYLNTSSVPLLQPNNAQLLIGPR